MKNNKKDKLTWRRLDNSAKIFPMSTGEKYTTKLIEYKKKKESK